MKKLYSHIKNLLLGMGITGKHLGRHAITIQYPEQKWTMPERSRGIVVLLSDKETGELNCTGCMLCMRACPTAAIQIDAPRGEDKKRTLKKFTVDNTLCCFCGLCEEACNFSAIKMATKYEFSVLDKNELIWDMHKLQEMGRDVDYIDTRKKKTVPVTEPKPAVEAPAPVENPVNQAGSDDAEDADDRQEPPAPAENKSNDKGNEG
ncbi:MAG: NADH-quinone oxidoreductase subunit I [candidate division Zixibacteria bacterium]|nr:NADH-quinone oxidoreductase subunit I [candidate division Zixibacteria bacterium]